MAIMAAAPDLSSPGRRSGDDNGSFVLPAMEAPRQVEWIVEVMRTNDHSVVAQERGCVDLCRLTVHTEGLVAAADAAAGGVLCRALETFGASETIQQWGVAAISALCAVPMAAEQVPHVPLSAAPANVEKTAWGFPIEYSPSNHVAHASCGRVPDRKL